jgi:hypothetical protein
VNSSNYYSVGGKTWAHRLLLRVRMIISNMSNWTKVFLVIMFIDVAAAIIGSIISMITNSLRIFPSYTMYFLNSLMIITALVMTFFAVDAVSIEYSLCHTCIEYWIRLLMKMNFS